MKDIFVKIEGDNNVDKRLSVAILLGVRASQHLSGPLAPLRRVYRKKN